MLIYIEKYYQVHHFNGSSSVLCNSIPSIFRVVREDSTGASNNAWPLAYRIRHINSREVRDAFRAFHSRTASIPYWWMVPVLVLLFLIVISVEFASKYLIFVFVCWISYGLWSMYCNQREEVSILNEAAISRVKYYEVMSRSSQTQLKERMRKYSKDDKINENTIKDQTYFSFKDLYTNMSETNIDN